MSMLNCEQFDAQRRVLREKISAMDIKYYAEWCRAQHVDENGEWNPDDDEYVSRLCSSVDEAKRVSVEESQRCNVVEWCRVTVVQFNPALDIPKVSPAAWDTIAVWHGDWQGNWEEDRS
jgi:hypothetical protein